MYLSEQEKQEECTIRTEIMRFEELERINEIFSDVPQMQIAFYGKPPAPDIGYGRKNLKLSYQRQAMAFIDTLFDFDMDQCMEDM